MALMIALIGEQPLPNFLLARHEHPNALLLVYTTPKTEPVYNNLEAALKSLKSETKIYGLTTDPYNVIAVIKDLEDKLKELTKPEYITHQPLVFNLTGGTKAMSLAAYHVAQHYNDASIVYMESEGKDNQIFRYEWKQQQLQFKDSIMLPECVQLKDFFNIHLGLKKWHVDGPSPTDGGLLERAVGDALASHGYEVMMGVKIMKDQVDIDVAIRSSNQFGIIEVKAGEEGRGLKGIQQLSTAKRHLGTFTQQFYVINVTATPSQNEIVEAANINVISLLDYRKGATSLSARDTKELIKRVDEIFKK